MFLACSDVLKEKAFSATLGRKNKLPKSHNHDHDHDHDHNDNNSEVIEEIDFDEFEHDDDVSLKRIKTIENFDEIQQF